MRQKIKKISKLLFIILVAYVIILIGGFLGVKYGLTNTAGVVDNESVYFQKADNEISQMEKRENEKEETAKIEIEKIKNTNYCKIKIIGGLHPINAQKIINSYEKTESDALIAKMILAVNLRLLANSDFQNKFNQCEENSQSGDYSSEELKKEFANATGQNVFPWMDQAEWQTIKDATIKDKDAINKAAQVAGIEPRLIVASMIVEQLRLFNSEREIFKKFFEPLKILGNANKISLGVMGIKEATAIQIENHLKDLSSPYYLGKDYENILDYAEGEDRFSRLTSEKDKHYYSYLYGALYLRQMMEQWKRAGYNIQYRMEILGTLFNVGFPQSKPNPSPKVGGSSINIGDGKYSFGSLAYEFYYSGELADDFPYYVK